MLHVFFIVFQIGVALTDLAIGSYVLWKNPRGLVNRSFCIFAAGIGVWAGSVALLGHTQLFAFAEIALYSGHVMVAGIVLLAETFPDKKQIEKRFFLVFVPLAIITILTPFNLFIRSAVRGVGGNIEPVNGPLFPLMVIVVGGYIVLSAFLLVRRYVRLTGIAKVQMRYLILGAGIFIAGMFIADLLLPALGIFEFNMLGPIFSIAFLGFTAYAILRYQLMDIRVIIKRGISYALVIISVAIVFFGAEFIIEKFFYTNDEVVDIVAAMVGAFAFSRFRSFFEDVTDRIFFRGDYDYSKAVQELGPLLNETIDLDKLLGSIREFLKRTVKPTMAIFVFENDGDTAKGYDVFSDKASHWSVQETTLMMEMASMLPRKPLYVQDVNSVPDAEVYQAISNLGRRMGIAAIIPLFSKEERASILFLGKKLSDEIFGPKDKGLLAVLSHQAGMAIENSRLYEKIRRYNEELERRVIERTEQVRNMYEMQSQFLTDISHELQTPIAIVQGNLELLDQEKAAAMKDAVRVIRTTIEGMSRLVTNLLGIAKLNFSKNKFYKTPISVETLLEEAHGDCFILAKNKGLDFSFLSEPLLISGDSHKLKEVLLNLLSNAFTHTSSGGSVFLGARQVGKYAEIVVTDTGSGIAPENLPHIFDRFYRINNELSRSNGIGLNICKQIIEAHDGTINVQSIEGKGSSFIICLPILP